jgi:hypothetical protein
MSALHPESPSMDLYKGVMSSDSSESGSARGRNPQELKERDWRMITAFEVWRHVF